MTTSVTFVGTSGATHGVCVISGPPTAITSSSSSESDGDELSECADESGAEGSESWLSSLIIAGFSVVGTNPLLSNNSARCTALVDPNLLAGWMIYTLPPYRHERTLYGLVTMHPISGHAQWDSSAQRPLNQA